MWDVVKTCPINSDYNAGWYFFEDSDQFIKQY